MKKIEHGFAFADSGDAYDCCQCRDELAGNGIALLIKSEGVVGLSGAWPVAVTINRGHLHDLNPDYVERHGLEKTTHCSADQIRTAVELAQVHGFPIDPIFQPFAL